MTFFEEMAQVAVELIGEGSEFGEALTFSRRSDGNYDRATRKAGNASPLVMPAFGTFDSELTPASLAGALAATHERVVMAVPPAGAAWRPGQDDRCDGGGGQWIVMETAHVIKQGIDILWIAGLKSA